jgi:predicted membrane channel-forming protein YqfA (hemolysin III family)
MTLVLSTLAVFNFYNSFAPLKDEKAGGLGIFINKIVYFALSVGVIGVLFRLENWSGYDVMLMLGCISLAIGLAFVLFINSKESELKIFSSRVILRILVILAVGVLLYFTPRENLIKLRLIKEMRMPQTEQGIQSPADSLNNSTKK